MTKPDPEKSSRRDFLTGAMGRKKIREIGDQLADRLTEEESESAIPSAGPMIRLSVNAMACEFAISMNPGSQEQVSVSSGALELLEPLEQKMTIYRESSDLSRINRLAFKEEQFPNHELFEVLLMSQKLYEETKGAFDPTMGPLIQLWRNCKFQERLPDEEEIQSALSNCGMSHVSIKEDSKSIRFTHPDVSIDLGGIGKGFAIDQIVPSLIDNNLENFLFHGGHSSLYAKGFHNSLDGWPIGIRNPLVIEERLATVLLRDQAMSTSGSNVQYYRFQGKRYGHILDPRTGYPADCLLSAVVFAPTAAMADALSTAFFVMGQEDSLEYCRNHPEVGAILVPPAEKGRKIKPAIIGVDPSQIFFLHGERDLDSVDYFE